MSRRRSRRNRNPNHQMQEAAPRQPRPEGRSGGRSDSRPPRHRPRPPREREESVPAWVTARIGVQGAGHPPADAPFEERMAPYVAVVDSMLMGAARQLGDNVDVSFMKADFARLIGERMLVAGMGHLLASAGSERGAAMLETLVVMLEEHGIRRERHDRAPRQINGHGHPTAEAIVAAL